MKQASKVFIWIGMILQCVFIYPIVVGVLALKKIDEAKNANELQTLGILTLLFCSLLGGIFMLCIKDEEMSKNNVSTEIVETKPSSQSEKVIKMITMIGIYLSCLLVVLSIIFNIVGCMNCSGLTYIPLILNIFQILLLIPIIIMYSLNRNTLTFASSSLLIVFTLLSIATIPLSFFTYYDWTYGGPWQYMTVFVLGCVITIISVVLLILNFATKQVGKKVIQNNEESKPVNKMENELNQVKALFETNVITEKEYDKLRDSIIAKYYN